MGRVRLLVSDFLMSFMWVWSGVLIKVSVSRYLGLSHQPVLEAVKMTLSIINMFFFALLGIWTHGGAYNPLTVLAGAISGDFSNFLFCVGARIPTQLIMKFTSRN
ncbi:probable aquaporin SIP2-1 [Prosopis cineraria]|uniref:probable aquaporin SIP2-1 n=1 Tax=Prosopis cineraria TaxID=364024 RepID=UPI00240F15CB|nr:probable aquaporin SIP2-1 [Prosopis cineraria]